MSVAPMDIVFEDFARIAQRTTTVRDRSETTLRKLKPALRIALLYREQLRIPNASAWLLRVLSGKAWVSFEGQDFELESGGSLPIPSLKDGAIISALGGQALLFEIT